ncbi:MAG: flagellar motor protein MotB [Planctomycetes bacterium]|nr:flagellar motor protein MotB [Planctomycetota bacterium]
MAKPRKLLIGAPAVREKDDSEVRWLMSYSDFMMQLVCLFILLYSVSSLDKGRMARLAAAYRASVGLGELAAHETRTSGDKLAIGDRPILGGDLGGGDVPRDVRYSIEALPGGFRAAFDAPVFEPGAAALTAGGAGALDASARVLRAYAGRLVVTAAGDDATDGDPLRLALARSQAVVERLSRAGLDPRFITTAGNPAGDLRRVTIELRTD